MSEQQSKPYYRNAPDTLGDVRISPKQLSHWKSNGLFSPQLGSKSRFFTRRDTERLRFLKRLIADLGLNVTSVKKLLGPLDARTPPGLDLAVSRTYIDVASFRLVVPRQAIQELLAQAVANSDSELLRLWFKVLAYQMCQSIGGNTKNAQVYEAELNTLLEDVRAMSRLARLNHEEDFGYYLSPHLPSEVAITPEEGDRLSVEKKSMDPIKRIEVLSWEYLF